MKYLLVALSLFLNTKTYSQNTTSKSTVNSQGVTIDFTDEGKSDTTLLFVHGWCINKTYWQHQVDFFRNEYRVVTVDLAGHGLSGANRNVWSVEEFGKDILAVINHLHLSKIILIGHSMAGDIALEVSTKIPDHILGLIAIDSYTDIGKDFSEDPEAKRFFKSLREDFKKEGPTFVQTLFFERTDSANRARVFRDFENTSPIVAIESLNENVKYSGKQVEKLKAWGKKIYLINSDKSPVIKEGFERNKIAYNVVTINGTGHYPMIEKPDEFNSLLAQTLSQIKSD